jgi:transcriptional regulator with PAS, ATPase and Fis domain
MKILLTFTGFHDPFAEVSASGEKESGPVLTVASEKAFDRVFLFSTPGTSEITQQTLAELQERHKGLAAEICDVPLRDPTNYLGILKQLRTHFKRIQGEHPEAEFFICVSSGTPHMHASWLMLAASGEIPARILQTRAAKFVREGESRVTEIDFTNPQFPQIKPFGALPEADQNQDFRALCTGLGIVGDHELFLRELQSAFTLAQYDSPVLLLGETGAGKEVFASLIHRASTRAARPFVSVNCAAFSENLIESQLFGHCKGAFTGADFNHDGFFKVADGGTLFLDEMGEMPLPCQAKLLRALQFGKIQRLGDSKESSVNVRVIAATNVDVKQAVEAKKLRKDLYFRFQANLHIPALRDRRSDIPKLALHFLERWNQKYQKPRRLSQAALIALMKHPWPGNVRELEGVVVTSAQLCPGKVVEVDHLLFDETLASTGTDALPEPQEGFDLNQYLSTIRQKLIERAMKRSDDNRTRAGQLLGISPQAMSQYLRNRK